MGKDGQLNPDRTAQLEAIMAKMPTHFRAPLYSWSRVEPFTYEDKNGAPVASYLYPPRRVILRNGFFTENKAWATLVHECTHAILHVEGTTLQKLRDGSLLLGLLGQTPGDPKFNSWRELYSSDDPDYSQKIANGAHLTKLLGKPLKGYDNYAFGNYYETIPAIVELYCRHYTRRWPEFYKPLLRWAMQRFAALDTMIL